MPERVEVARSGAVVRFAPSPTGEIHIGNARIALYNAALARRTGGRFILRFDDTDVVRSEERFVASTTADLDWLGIVPDLTVRQSDRLSLYAAAAASLRASNHLYPAYESAAELERRRALARARGLPPVYDRAALRLSAAEREKLEAEGRRPHWRFRLPDGARAWDDLCRGPQSVPLSAISDPVLVREDGTYLYTLTSVVDDIDLAVTDVVRGEDHVTNTAVQIAIFEALEAAVPRFAHLNLLVRADGEPLSKRDNPLSLARLRTEGIEPAAVAAVAMLTGTSHPLEAIADQDALFARADLAAVSRAPATFDPADILRLNAALLHAMPYAAAAGWLATLGAADPLFWSTVRENLSRREDVLPWLSVWRCGPLPDARADPADPVLAAALAGLPPEPWDEGTFRAWTREVGQATDAKGRALFMPLRVALTGRTDGPAMASLILLLGRTEVFSRLERARSG